MTNNPTVTIVSASGKNGHVSQVCDALEKHGISSEVIDFDETAPIHDEMKKLGEVTLWRSSSLSKSIQRSSIVNYLNKTHMINEAVFLQPSVAEKYYQQHSLTSVPSLSQYAIATYRVKNKSQFLSLIEKGTLSFPVIAKPNDGCRGEGIHLLQSSSDIEKLELPIGRYVLQGFLPNDGDWRVIVVGGRVIGTMKRIAQAGSFLNNVSQGAKAVKEEDGDVLKFLYDVAPKVAALFRLRFCGVDVIRDSRTGEFKILEVNTAPQWTGEYGFDSVTGVSSAEEIAKYIEFTLALKTTTNKADIVDEYYKASLDLYPSEKFHYASRLWLWTGDAWARQALDELKQWYIGDTDADHEKVVTDVLAKVGTTLSVNQRKPYRRKYFEKYAKLPVYNALLFKTIFCDSIYGINLRPYIRKHISDGELLAMFRDLMAHHDAVRVLSTHAINFLYLLKNYFKDRISLASVVIVDPSDILKLCESYEHLVESGELTSEEALKLRIYMLTHAIIGESRFYQRPARKNTFRVLCSTLENIIDEHYFDISLDNKCEFLVCAELCGYTPKNKQMILNEASRSISWAGPFIVDKDAQAVRHALRTSEHRNVLFVMASVGRTVTGDRRPRKIPKDKPTIGRLATMALPDFGNMRIVAKVDTGATRSSLCVSNIYEKDGALHFSLLFPGHPMYTGEEVVTDNYIPLNIKNPGNKLHERYATAIRFAVNDEEVVIDCTLTDRKHMLYPALIGRDFLRGRYNVDIDSQFVPKVVKSKADV